MVLFMLGVVIRILVTVSAALSANAGRTPVCPAGAGCPIVNWDEARDRYDHLRRIRLGRPPLALYRPRFRSIFQTKPSNIRDNRVSGGAYGYRRSR